MNVDGSVAQILFPAAADGVEAFQGKAERINPHMAHGAVWIAGMLFDQLADGQPLGIRLVLRKSGDVFGRPRELFPQQNFANPVAA